MFVQVIQGRANDAVGLQRQLDRWDSEVRPGAIGFLGATGGVADDGTAIFLARFESESAARANSDRQEQGAWWNETAKYLDDVTFRDCSEVDTTLAGGSDEAGFIQVMQARVTDKARLQELEAEFMPRLSELRPDLIGSVRAWDGDRFIEAIYFTDEGAAREGEAKMGEDTSGDMAEFESLVQDLTYIDLKKPWLRSA